ncbi:MAG: 50S ribosomal protein L13 [Candidatus Nomurabacteria bacterium]|jgi:large subunit ribosomal protein L13|nr:50S ribosomal protein L13 [Candidatus Nomurabacteria bacterium]
MKLFKTFSQKTADIKREWFVIDASENNLGRIATIAANLLAGKKKITVTPHVDNGDFVIITNAAKVGITGNKLTDKLYHRHSGYIGNMKTKNLQELMRTEPERVITEAIAGMLPKNKLQGARLARLKVFRGAEHTHTAQTPKKVEVK